MNNMKQIKILYIVRDSGGCGFYRCIQPATFIKRMGIAETEHVLQQATEEQLLSADLVVLQDTGSINGSNIAQFCFNNKIPFVCEFDDFIQHVSPHNLAGYGAWNPSTLFVYRAMESAKKANAIIVSTPQLAREYFPYNNNIFIMPNYLDKELWENPIVKKNDGKIRIGWMGGNAHADDLKMISKVLHKIVKEGKGNILFETMGMTKHELENVFPFEEFPGTCPKCGYEGELHHFPGENLKEYSMVVASKGWDIVVAPVIENSFGNAKSDIKIKEYSAIQIPMVASPIVPYRDAEKDGAKIRFATTFGEWYNEIKYLINHPEERDKIARNNKDWVDKYWIQDNAQKIFEIYSQILGKGRNVS